MRLFLSICLSLVVWACGAQADGSYNAVVTVNGDAVTAYELRQRRLMLEVFNTPGDLNELAREQLIEERLKSQAVRRAGLRIKAETLRTEMEQFAARANLSYEDFLKVLQSRGIAEASLRDFVRAGVTWRDYIRMTYGEGDQVDPADAARRLRLPGRQASGVEVLLSEIIIPAPPRLAGRARAEANRIAQMRSTAAFSAAARRVSALPSRANGGRLSWTPITNFPPQLHDILLGLKTGEVTAPLPITNGIALFQMRGVRENTRAFTAPAKIEYLTYRLAGGLSDATQARAAQIKARVDTCDDFYGINRGKPAALLQRQTVAPSQIPRDVAQVIAGLDADELSYGLTRNNGQDLLMVMVCRRLDDGAEEPDLEAVAQGVFSQRLEAKANAHLADLRARATIR